MSERSPSPRRGSAQPRPGQPRSGPSRPTQPRLARQAWVDAAADALFRGGPAAVAVEPLAAALGVTKGSFYWHFASRAELLAEAMQRWEHRATTEVIAANEAAGGTARERLLRLLHRVTSPGSGATAEVRLLAAAPTDPQIADALARVVRRRLDYVEALLAEAGAGAEDAAPAAGVLYAAYVGAVHLAMAVPAVLGGLDAEATGRLMLAGVLHRGPNSSPAG